jgi:hypothetical protein
MISVTNDVLCIRCMFDKKLTSMLVKFTSTSQHEYRRVYLFLSPKQANFMANSADMHTCTNAQQKLTISACAHPYFVYGVNAPTYVSHIRYRYLRLTAICFMCTIPSAATA